MIAPFVDADWLRAHPETVVADVRWDPATGEDRDGYDAGHLPGAVFVPLDSALSGEPTPQSGRHPLPEPDAFAAAMSALGIGDDDTVVAHDGGPGVIAARLVWMLRALGHDAALLDGGLTAWDGPLESSSTDVEAGQTSAGRAATGPARFTPRPWPEDLLAAPDDLLAAPGDMDAAAGEGDAAPGDVGAAAGDPDPAPGGPGGAVLIDARPTDRFAGTTDSPLDPRPGHIPGARSVPVREHVGPDGRLRPAADLRARFAAAGVAGASGSAASGADAAGAGGPAPVVSYCGSGVTACHNLLVMEHLGLGRGRLYPGSWSQWAADPERPVEIG